MKKNNLAFVDIETTGFNVETQEIIEIGLVLVKQIGDDGTKFEIIEELELKIKPEHIETADPQALRVNGYDPSQWIFASSLADAMKVFAEKTKDAIFVAHNLAFDYTFMDKAFRTTGVENQMFYAKLDTISMAYAKHHKNPDVERFSLQRLAEHYGVVNSNAHTALADARTLFMIYEKMMQE